MAKCFVIQPFDGGRFDKRYEDTFAPAVEAAGLEPYRVDKDPSVSIPIDDIQAGIESSAICFADITMDNPNVWFELGYAIAAQKDVILVCEVPRESSYPFDVQHRSVIEYSCESASDFAELKEKIVSSLKARLIQKERMGQVGRIKSLTSIEGLDQHEIATLVATAEQLEIPGAAVAAYQIRNTMEYAGFANIATILGLKALLDNGMLVSFEDSDDRGELFAAYRVTDVGMSWLFENQDKLTLKQEPRELPGPPADDDIPF